MTTKLTILSEMRKVADEQAKTLAPLSDDLVLLDSGLDSLCFAVRWRGSRTLARPFTWPTSPSR